MDKKISVDEILKSTTDEDLDNLNNHEINIESILNEYASSLKDNYVNNKLSFNPSLERRQSYGAYMHDKELDEILKQADEIYSNQELNNMNIDDYKLLLQNDILSKPEELTIYKRKTNEAENLPYKTPLEFVNYMETMFTKSNIESNQNVFILKNYKQHSKLKFSVLDFTKKSVLSGRFQKSGNLITSIAAYNNSIIIGNNIGTIKTYSCDQQLEFNTLSHKEIDICEKRTVVCMDISGDGELLLAGYSNGYVAVWELSTLKVRKLIKDIHKNSIIACKFIKSDSKKSDFITSDIDGQVFKITLKAGYFSMGVESKVLIRNNTPVFLINILKLEEEDKKYFGLEIQKSLMIAFGCLEFVMIYMLEPEQKKLIRFEKPKYIKDNSVPDISLGIGFVPNIQEANIANDSMMDATGNQSFWLGQKNVDPSKPQILLSISWGRIIYLYCLPVSNNVIHGFTTAGHYVNLNSIIRMGFLANSIIFFFDKMKLCRVINTSLITPGEVCLSADNEQPISIVDSLRKPELQEGYLVDPDLKYQTYIVDKADGTARATYNNHIISFNKNIFVIANKDFYHGKLLNWEQCLNNLNSNSEWHSALSLGLDIYNGRETALADIPQDDMKRKLRVGNTLRTLIHQYAIMHMNNDNKFNKEQDPKQWLSNCINTCIEFCIEIESIDFLLTHLQPIFHSEGYEDEFIQRLEPFIVCDKIKNQQLQQLTIHKIIDFYIKNNKFHTLSQILIHLDIQSIDVDYIKHICNQYSLITPLIYVYTNNEDEDYFYPVKKIFEIFEKAKEIKNFTSYSDVVKNVPIEELENSKQYIGHKLMWYINLCINGKKIHNSSIQESKYRRLIVKIISWILLDEVLPKLLVFDSNTLFSILIKYFEDEKLLSIISCETSENFSGINNKIMDLRPITIIDILVGKVKEIDSINKNIILQDLYEFIGKVSLYINSICKSLIIESIKYLLSNTGNENNIQIVNNFAKYIENINNIIIDMIDSRKDLDKKDYYNLLEASEISPYVLVKIHLLKLYKNYKRCLEVFLQSDIKLQDKEKKVFEWIDLTFRELKDEDDENFNSLKEEVLNKLPQLADISIDNVTSLVESWYENEQDVIIEKLDKAENLQLKYVENLIEKIKDDVDYSGEHDKKYDQYIKILNLHIKLLCKLNPNQVLPNLKKRSSYPIDECLKKCLDYKVYDAAIYLMQNTGAFKDALLLAIGTLRDTFEKVIENINSSNFNEKIHNEKIDEIKTNIKTSIAICENNVNKNETSEDNQEMWFMILEQLYNMIEIAKDKNNGKFKMYAEELNKKLSSELKDVLEKMCSYVSIEAIIKNVTEKYKQAEFKEFKKLLLNMLSSYSHLKNILISAKNLLSNSVLYNVIELKKLNQKGNKFNFNKCDQCSKGFNPTSEDPIVVFGCGHKCHSKCVSSNDVDPYCITCRKNEIENSLFTIGKKSLIQRDMSIRDSLNESIVDNITDNIRRGRNDNLICRLKAFDKHYIEKSSLLLNH